MYSAPAGAGDKFSERLTDMSHKNNQCIHCSVESCQHHEQDGVCGLMDVQIAPKECCCNGKADESLCSSYKCRW